MVIQPLQDAKIIPTNIKLIINGAHELLKILKIISMLRKYLQCILNFITELLAEINIFEEQKIKVSKMVTITSITDKKLDALNAVIIKKIKCFYNCDKRVITKYKL